MNYPALSPVAAASLLIAATFANPAVAKERCNPPHLQCGQSPITYECPPCPPGGIQLARPDEIEKYRRTLESYREGIEANRADRANGSLVGYDKAIKKYQDGISTYKDAMGAISDEPK